MLKPLTGFQKQSNKKNQCKYRIFNILQVKHILQANNSETHRLSIHTQQCMSPHAYKYLSIMWLILHGENSSKLY